MLTLADFWSQELRWETQTKSSQRPCESLMQTEESASLLHPTTLIPGLALLAFVTLTLVDQSGAGVSGIRQDAAVSPSAGET